MQIEIARATKYGMYGIVAFDKQGYEWVLKHEFKRDDPRTMTTLGKIRERKMIDTRYWRKRVSGKW